MQQHDIQQPIVIGLEVEGEGDFNGFLDEEAG